MSETTDKWAGEGSEELIWKEKGEETDTHNLKWKPREKKKAYLSPNITMFLKTHYIF